MPLPVDILFLRTRAPKLVIPNPRAPFKLDCRGVRDLLFGLQDVPAGDFNRTRQLLPVTHCISNFRLFKRLRTLCCSERLNCARLKTTTLLFSVCSALFRKNTRVGGYPFSIQTFQPSNLQTFKRVSVISSHCAHRRAVPQWARTKETTPPLAVSNQRVRTPGSAMAVCRPWFKIPVEDPDPVGTRSESQVVPGSIVLRWSQRGRWAAAFGFVG
jgi:hypothetical protein